MLRDLSRYRHQLAEERDRPLFKIFGNDTLIKLDAIKTAIQRGQVPIGEIRLGVYGNEDPMYILAGLPFIASTYAEAWLLKDLQKEYFDAKFAEIGLKVLYYSPWPGQGFQKRPARS